MVLDGTSVSNSLRDFFRCFVNLFNRLVKRDVILTRPALARRDAPDPEGRSKRKTEAYVGWYVEGLSEARTQPTTGFTSLS